MEGIIGRN